MMVYLGTPKYVEHRYSACSELIVSLNMAHLLYYCIVLQTLSSPVMQVLQNNNLVLQYALL